MNSIENSNKIITMEKNLSEKISTLQKNFYDLNSLFELSIIATQADSIEDLIDKVTTFVTEAMGLKNVRFFINHDRVYYMVASHNSEDNEFFQFENDEEGFWEVLNKNEFIRVADRNGNPIYRSFWEKYDLQNLDSYYFKLFQKILSRILSALWAKSSMIPNLRQKICTI